TKAHNPSRNKSPRPTQNATQVGSHKGGQGAPLDKSQTLPPMCAGSPTPTPTLNRCQKTPPSKSQMLPLEIQVNAGTRKGKPKTEFWRATETNRLTRQACPKK
ncbi:MAG: hypothetical protein Q8L68_04455, partial [Methylococcales bacterium]|nr:hypothetical protein [Methylococcales bacterium]